MGTACEQKQIRMLVSPTLWDQRKAGAVAPPRPAEEKLRTAPSAGPQPQSDSPPPSPATPETIPDLVGMPIADARTVVAAIRSVHMGSVTPPERGNEPQLMLLEITREVPAQAPGTVLSQTPAAGSRLERRTTIEVVVAK